MSGTAMVPLVGATVRRFAEQPRRSSVRPEEVVDEPWIWVEGADPRARAFWSLEAFRGGRQLRTGTRITSVEEAFGAAAAGVAITCQGASAVTAVGAGFPQPAPLHACSAS